MDSDRRDFAVNNAAPSDKLSTRFEHLINKQCHHELIVFDLPKISSEERMKTVLRIAHSLSASLSLSKMIKISGRTSSSDSFITKFTTISKKNELIARARRRLGFIASDIRDAWHTYRKSSLFERSTKAEQHAKTRQMVRDCNIRHIWMQRGHIF